MFSTICDQIPVDRDYPARTRVLDILGRVLNGQLYDVLNYEFHEERSAGGEYIPLRLRRPSVRYALPRIVVEDSVALLFSDGHFPAVDSPDEVARDAVAALMRDIRFNSVMTEAALRGSVGSVAILLRAMRGRLFADVFDTLYLTPQWDHEAPDTLLSVTERYKVSGASLTNEGFDFADPDTTYWFCAGGTMNGSVGLNPRPLGRRRARRWMRRGLCGTALVLCRWCGFGTYRAALVWTERARSGQQSRPRLRSTTS